eukprot:21974-Chlamydomonas_euryale.AAC.1
MARSFICRCTCPVRQPGHMCTRTYLVHVAPLAATGVVAPLLVRPVLRQRRRARTRPGLLRHTRHAPGACPKRLAAPHHACPKRPTAPHHACRKRPVAPHHARPKRPVAPHHACPKRPVAPHHACPKRPVAPHHACPKRPVAPHHACSGCAPQPALSCPEMEVHEKGPLHGSFHTRVPALAML